jgi:peptide/nickel transport system permease protein
MSEAASTVVVLPTVQRKTESPTRRTIRRFVRHRLAMAGLTILVLITIACMLGSDELALKVNIRMGYANQPPGTVLPVIDNRGAPILDAEGNETYRTYLLGTDGTGRDVLSRVLVGGRVSLLVALVSVAIATLIGTIVGVAAGYAGGRVDNILMRVVDVVLSFPTILLLLVVAAIVGPGLVTLVIMIGAVTWASGARIVRGQVLALREATFMEAARVVGLDASQMIRWHVLPNIVAPLVVFATFGVASVIIFEASLSYLGLGIQPPTPSWGNMLNSARSLTVLERYWWQWVPPAIMIVLTVLAVNFVGDGLRDALDQRATNDK